MAQENRSTSTALRVWKGGGTQPNRVTSTALRVWLGGPTGQPNAVTSTALRVWTLPTRPDAPTIDVLGMPGALLVSTSAFSPAFTVPDDEHVSTQYQVAETTDPTFAAPVYDETFDFPSAFLTEALIEGLGDEWGVGTYLVRARHYGGIAASEWSEAVEATTIASVVAADTPTASVLDVGIDYVVATTSAFSHPDGETTAEAFDPDNPLPYLSNAQFQIRVQSTGTVVSDTGWVPALSDPPEWTDEDLADDTAYQIRARHYDGYNDAPSAWSAWVNFTTDAIPPVRPGAPDVTVTDCDADGTATVTCTAFSPPAEDPTATHKATRWRAQMSHGGGGSFVTEVAGELLAWEWYGLSHGTWVFDAAHQDSAGRWGLYGGTDTCVVVEEPPVPQMHHTGTTRICADSLLSWDMPASPDEAWVFEGQVSADDGASFATVFSDLTDEYWTFTISGRSDGAYLFRVRACYDDGSRCGPWAYLVLRVDRACETTVYDFSTVTDLANHPEWEILWQNDDKVVWEPIDEQGNAGGGFGILTRSDRYIAGSRSILAFTELGEPTIYDAEVEFCLWGNEDSMWWWRWHSLQYLRAGLGYNVRGVEGVDDTTGLQIEIDPGGNPVPLMPFGGTCGGDCECNCKWWEGCNCTLYVPQYLQWAREDRARGVLFQYGLPRGQPGIRWAARPRPVTTMERVPNDGDYKHGMHVSLKPCNGGSGPTLSCPYTHTKYILRFKSTRTVSGGIRIRCKLIGPGIDVSEAWHFDKELTYAQYQAMECGFTGLSLSHAQGYKSADYGIIYTSFSITPYEYDLCQPPPPPEPEPEPGEAELVKKAWAFVLDGHVFYVLNRMNAPAIIYDVATGQWQLWHTNENPAIPRAEAYWNMFRGIMWKGRVVAADRTRNIVWELDPHSFFDQGSKKIRRAVTAYQPCRGSRSKRQGSMRITARREVSEEEHMVKMRFSDDGGRTWSNYYWVELSPEDISKRIEYRSLGRIRAPGRIWEIEDEGGLVRIEGADSDTEGEE